MRTEYETKRLVLRLSSPYIAGAVQSLYVNNAEFFAKNETAVKHIETMSINDLSRHLTVDAKLSTVGHSYRFWIFEKGSERCIGCVALTDVIRGSMLTCYLNYKLDQKFQHKGYMIEAAKFCVAFAFEKLGLHRIEADILPSNISSLRVVQKLGFKNDGIAEKLINVNGVWKDHVRMILINPCV